MSIFKETTKLLVIGVTGVIQGFVLLGVGYYLAGIIGLMLGFISWFYLIAFEANFIIDRGWV